MIDTSKERIAKYSPPPNENGCIIWAGPVAFDGYPVLSVNKRHKKVCRLILNLTDPKIFACHRCDVPLCVNKDHLFAGDVSVNSADMKSKFRQSKGETHRQKVSIGLKRNGHATSKYPGVCWIKTKKRWRASIKVKGIIKTLGYFRDEDKAAQAYLDAKRKECPKPA